MCECCTIFQTRFTKTVFLVYVCCIKKLQAHRKCVYPWKYTGRRTLRNLNRRIHIRNLIVIDNPNILSNKFLQNLFAISNKTHANALLLISFALSNKELFSNLCTILKWTKLIKQLILWILADVNDEAEAEMGKFYSFT